MVTHGQAWDGTRERRISYLAWPKVNHQIICDRISVYWTDKLPSKTHRFTIPVLTPRQAELSRSKKMYQGFEEDRSLPIWPVSAASKQAVASPRVKELAHPKLVNNAWEADRPAYPTHLEALITDQGSAVPGGVFHTHSALVSKGAMTAAARERTTHLANPKKRDFSAKLAAPSTPPRTITQLTRTEYLARPKTDHPSYLQDKPVRWAVSEGARNAVLSARLSELARPKVRKEIYEGYNPYRISNAALHAEASPRLRELSIPQRIRKKR